MNSRSRAARSFGRTGANAFVAKARAAPASSAAAGAGRGSMAIIAAFFECRRSAEAAEDGAVAGLDAVTPRPASVHLEHVARLAVAWLVVVFVEGRDVLLDADHHAVAGHE